MGRRRRDPPHVAQPVEVLGVREMAGMCADQQLAFQCTRILVGRADELVCLVGKYALDLDVQMRFRLFDHDEMDRRWRALVGVHTRSLERHELVTKRLQVLISEADRKLWEHVFDGTALHAVLNCRAVVEQSSRVDTRPEPDLLWIMKAWIEYLLALSQAETTAIGFHFIYTVKEEPYTFSIAPGEISKQEACTLIDIMIDSFLAGQASYLPFYPPFGELYFKNRNPESTDPILTREKLYSAFETDKESTHKSPSSDMVYIEKTIHERSANTGLFCEASVIQLNENIQKLLMPIYDKCNQIFKSE